MSSNILFVFEGKNPEKQITENLKKYFINENKIITCAYCTTIYKLYKEISADLDLNVFSLLKEIEFNKDVLKEYDRLDFAEIYLFFDYDGHATNASDDKLNYLLNFFNEETENGKLYLSYPMVESLMHIENFQTFEDLTVLCKKNISYKKFVKKVCLQSLIHIDSFDLETWNKLIAVHLKKMNKIVNDSFEFPSSIIDQLKIFQNQNEKYIVKKQEVAILNAFPIFLHDYYGNLEIRKRLKIQII